MEFAHIYHGYLALCQPFKVNYPVVNTGISDFTSFQRPPNATLALVSEVEKLTMMVNFL